MVFFHLFQFKVKGYKSVVAGQRLRIMSNILAITNNGFFIFKHHFYHLEQIIWPVSSFQENTEKLLTVLVEMMICARFIWF